MKISLALITLALSFSAMAFEDGIYHCGSRDSYAEATYNLKTLTINNVDLPFLEITKKYYKDPKDPNSVDHTYQIKGVATVYTDEAGEETLALGNLSIELTAGRITCRK